MKQNPATWGLWAALWLLIGVAVADMPAAPRTPPVRHLPVVVEDVEARIGEDLPRRPRTRAECEDGPRPCPFASCRYNLLVEVARRNGTLRVNLPGLEETGEIPDGTPTCALDEADHGPRSQQEIAALLDVSVEWIRQCERAGEAEARFNGGPALRALLAEHADDPARSGGPSTLADLANDETSVTGNGSREARAAAEDAALERWAAHAAALMRAGLRARVAWTIADLTEDDGLAATAGADSYKGEGDDEDEDLEEDTMQTMTNGVSTTKSEARKDRRELRDRILDALRAGPLRVRDLGAQLGEDAERIRSAMRGLRAEGAVHSDRAGVESAWTLGPVPSAPAPSGSPEAPRQASKKKSGQATAPPPATVSPALLEALLTASPARLRAVDRVLRRLQPK